MHHMKQSKCLIFNAIRMYSSSQTEIAIVGSGISGLTAAAFALRAGAKHVTLFEKESRIGGNTMKASTGINGCDTDAQRSVSISDSVSLFLSDTIKMLNINSNDESQHRTIQSLVGLYNQSQFIIDYWLIHVLKVDLQQLVQLRGHSQKRTYKPLNDGIGSVLLKATLTFLQANYENQFQILFDSKVVGLKCSNSLPDNKIQVSGLEFKILNNKDLNKNCGTNQNISFINAKATIICSGGYASDIIGKNALISEHRPDLIGLPSSNGPFATGDLLKACKQIGAQLIDIEKIQLHPTGFIDPLDPNSKYKILASERLRDVGAVIIDNDGQILSELGLTSNQIAHKMLNSKQQYWLVLSTTMAQNYGKNFLFYYKIKGFFKKYPSLQKLYQDQNWQSDFYQKIVSYFANDVKSNEEFYIAKICPIIHYTLGGIQTNVSQQVLQQNSENCIDGLFAAGEAQGGIHGEQRLWGNSLIHCIASGMLSGTEAFNYISKL